MRLTVPSIWHDDVSGTQPWMVMAPSSLPVMLQLTNTQSHGVASPRTNTPMS